MMMGKILDHDDATTESKMVIAESKSNLAIEPATPGGGGGLSISATPGGGGGLSMASLAMGLQRASKNDPSQGECEVLL